MYRGNCECGSIAFEVPELRRDVTFCHCGQCRRTSGHLWAATRAPWTSLAFSSDSTLTWYASSDFAKRGFCSRCGSSLFYRMNDEDGVGIAAGAIEAPNDLKPGKHIFAADKANYYDIADDAPQIAKF